MVDGYYLFSYNKYINKNIFHFKRNRWRCSIPAHAHYRVASTASSIASAGISRQPRSGNMAAAWMRGRRTFVQFQSIISSSRSIE
jgi:hypothetical protein